MPFLLMLQQKSLLAENTNSARRATWLSRSRRGVFTQKAEFDYR